MKKYLITIVMAAFVIAACDLIDGTNVENPDILLDEAVDSPNSASGWLTAMDRRTGIVMNEFLTTAELASDNYVNRATFFNQNVEFGTIRDADTDIENTNFQFARLREQATYGLEVVIPDNDPDAAGTQIEAEMYFYLGYAHLLAGENMTALPAAPEGEPQSPSAHFELAIQAFENAITIVDNPEYHLGIARANYGLGNQDGAVAAAQEFLANAPADFVRFIEFDGSNGPENTFELAVYGRQSFNDLQPLPRLDFLDPKYGDLGGTQQSPIPMLKAEEAHLILAEAALADGNVPGAVSIMQDIIALVDDRPTRAFNETEEGRRGGEANPLRPNSSDFVVRADENAPFREDLVLDRTAETIVPTISGTSVDQDFLDDNTGNETEALRTLYLMRQEIFFGEGRRMADLGVRFPVSEVEALNNENVTDEHRTAVIPSYIPDDYNEMNLYEDGYNPDTDSFDHFEVTMFVDMNRVLAEQRGNVFHQ